MDTKDKQALMLYKQGYSIIQIAQVLDMDSSHVDALVQKDEQEQKKEIRFSTVEDDENHKLERTGQYGQKIDEENFKLIRQDIENGMWRNEICEKYNIAGALYNKLKRCQTYDDLCNMRRIEADKKQRHRPKNTEDKQEQGTEIRHFTEEDESHKVGRKIKLTRERFEEMKRLLAQGLSVGVVANIMGFSWQYIHKAKKFKTYDELMEYRKENAAKKQKATADESTTESQKQTNADRRRKRQRDYEAAKCEAKKLEKTIFQAAMENPDTLAEISKQLARIADVLEAMPKKRRFFKR